MSEPFARLLDWAARRLCARVDAATTLRAEWGPWLLELDGGPYQQVVLKVAPDGDPSFLATEAAAMALAAAHSIAAPSLIAVDLTGEDAGYWALMRTVLPGSNAVPAEPTTARLRALGAAAAAFHAVRVEPTTQLPLRTRHMPWKDLAAARRAGDEPTTPLLDAADRALRSCTPPDDELVFVHGDLWAGQMLFEGDECVGTVDWDAAGTGSYGVDLGSLRLDTALFHGVDAVDDVLAGWEGASGRAARHVAYWDLVAALNVEADMVESVPAMQATGRTDLDAATLNARRDAFVADALDRLRASP